MCIRDSFITEEIWPALPHEGESIIISSWPDYRQELNFKKEEVEFGKVMAAISAIRNRRSEMNVPPSRKARVYIESAEPQVFADGIPFIERLASASSVEVSESCRVEDAVQVITNDAKIFIPDVYKRQVSL